MKEVQPLKHTNLILGLLLILFGGGLLLWTVWAVPFIPAIVASLAVCFGIIFLYLVYYLDFNEFYLFLGMILIQGSIFALIKHKLPEYYLISFWPAFLFMTGLTLLLYALRKKRKRRSVFLVPSVTFIIMSLLFLPFSLKLTTYSLGEVIKMWWPLSLLIIGIALSAAHFVRSLKIKREGSDSRK